MYGTVLEYSTVPPRAYLRIKMPGSGGRQCGNIIGVDQNLKRTNEQRVESLNVDSSLAKPEILAVAATWVVHFSIVITRTVGIVDVGEKRGVEAAPFVSTGENAVYLVKYYQREGHSLEPKRGVGIP